jgi:glycerol uptake facilitator-like aquaporin
VFAAQVNGKYAAGDLAGAQESSRKAKQFALWSAISAGVLFGLVILLILVGTITGSDTNP